jgi:pyridoxal phosphate enzyme (YggS family)
MTSIFTVGENVRSFLGSVPKDVTLIGVTKTVGADKIKEAVESGLTDIGENKVQEATDKYPFLKDLNLKWHFIGSLQSNKIKKTLKIFDLIHSVDKFSLADMINKEALKLGKKQEVLLQINISQEETKSGFFVEELQQVLPEIAKLSNLTVKGLMTIGPNTEDEKVSRYCFSTLRLLMEKINQEKYFKNDLNILSMGMTNDYKIAIEEGATMIRLGRAIFGDRNK